MVRIQLKEPSPTIDLMFNVNEYDMEGRLETLPRQAQVAVFRDIASIISLSFCDDRTFDCALNVGLSVRRPTDVRRLPDEQALQLQRQDTSTFRLQDGR